MPNIVTHIYRYSVHTGHQILKDDYLSALGCDYDLRSPDFSYLMINELKDYYSTKRSLISTCRETAFKMGAAITNFYPELHKKVNALYSRIQLHRTTTTDSNFIYICDSADHMKRVAQSTSTHLAEINSLIHLAHQQKDPALDLQNFREIPALLKVTSFL